MTGAGATTMATMTIGELVKQRREALGLTQSELARRSGLRQNYISDVEKGNVAVPRDHNLDALGAVLGLSRGEFYRAAGMLQGLAEAAPPPPPPAEDEPWDPAAVVAYVESKPGAKFRAQLAEERARLPYPEYVAFCEDIYRAWSSNANLALRALRRGERAD